MPYKSAEVSRAYQRDYKRLKRAGESQTPGQTLLPPEFRLQTAQDVLALIGEQVEIVRADTETGKLEKARCLGYLATIALRAIETGELATRLEAIERTLKQRQP